MAAQCICLKRMLAFQAFLNQWILTVLERIKGCFTESIQTQIAAAEALPDAISRAAMTLVQSLLNGNKILCCGNGASGPTLNISPPR